MLIFWYNKTIINSLLTKYVLTFFKISQLKKISWIKPYLNLKIKLNKLNKFYVKIYFYYLTIYLWKFLPKAIRFFFSKKNKRYFILRRMHVFYLINLYLLKYFNFIFLNNFCYFLSTKDYKFNYNANKYLSLKIFRNFYTIKFFYITKLLPIFYDINLNFDTYQNINISHFILLKLNLTYLNFINIYKLTSFVKTKH